MVLCIIALPLFAVLGIFSATYRQLAKEAFSCVFKKVTFRPCDTGLDTRIKTSIVGPILRRSQRLGGFVYRNFTLLSWIFVVLSLLSLAGVAYGGYNYYIYGNCNGPSSSGFCVFDPSGANQQFSAGNASATATLGSCSTGGKSPSTLEFNWFKPELFPTLEGSNGKELWMIGCYNCPYTRQTWPVIRDLQRQYNFTLVFAHLPLQKSDEYASRVGICIQQADAGSNDANSAGANSRDGTSSRVVSPRFWSFADAMFAAPINSSRNESFVLDEAVKLGFDRATIGACAVSNATDDTLFYNIQNIAAVGVYGTPTIYDPQSKEALVGPKPVRVYRRLVD